MPRNASRNGKPGELQNVKKSTLDDLPCIVGVAQRCYRAADGDSPEPLQQWEEVSVKAAADSGKPGVLNQIDDINIVYTLSCHYDDAVKSLADKLGLKDTQGHLSGLSGTSAQHFVQQAAARIQAGESELSLVVGGEALATIRRYKKAGQTLPWANDIKRGSMPFEDPFHPTEIAHQVFQAYLTFAVLDSARRASMGLTLDENHRQQATMMAAMSEIAANNPNAWFHKAYSAGALYQITADNRMVAYPYSKHSVAFMDVDMAAAVLVTSHRKADELGVAQDKRVYLRGGAYTREPIYIAQRPDLSRSPAMQAAATQALQMAGAGIDDIALLDLYSCFPGSVNFAKDALGLSDNEPRALTVTGGLPYFGGPGNNYLTHAIASMVEKLRENPSELGLLNGVGMHMTNHVFGVYSAQPELASPVDVQATAAPDTCTITDNFEGVATIAAYSVEYSRHGQSGLAVCDTSSGQRCYARSDDPDLLRSMQNEEWVGQQVTVRNRDNVNSFSE